jgi:UDPglucose--hexose-1-phosphate uridylyltransferase
MSFDLTSHTHRRYNPLLSTFVMVAPHRTQRPWQGQQEKSASNSLPRHDPECYLCPGNKRAKGDINAEYTSTFIFENDYAAVKPEQPDLPFTEIDEEAVAKGDKSSLFLRTEGVTGIANVICFNPAHNVYVSPTRIPS